MSREELTATQDRIAPYIHRTPVLTSSRLNHLSGAQLYLKCENFQRTGSFKMRGASNAVASLGPDEQAKGVVAHSSGNFAQAVALAARMNGVDAHIVMPDNAPAVKREATIGYGATVYTSGPRALDREEMADAVQEKTGAVMLHPSNQWEVILGQGTSAMELMEDVDDLDYVMTPVGGGGLIAGTAMAVTYFAPQAKVIGAEPAAADDAFRSLRSGRIEMNETADTIADGLRTHLGDVNFPIIQRHVDSIICVEELEIIHALRLVWETMKIIIEPSCALPLAAVLKDKERFKGKRVGLILTGGNVDMDTLWPQIRSLEQELGVND